MLASSCCYDNTCHYDSTPGLQGKFLTLTSWAASGNSCKSLRKVIRSLARYTRSSGKHSKSCGNLRTEVFDGHSWLTWGKRLAAFSLKTKSTMERRVRIWKEEEMIPAEPNCRKAWASFSSFRDVSVIHNWVAHIVTSLSSSFMWLWEFESQWFSEWYRRVPPKDRKCFGLVIWKLISCCEKVSIQK
jgi:hypothetical protein